MTLKDDYIIYRGNYETSQRFDKVFSLFWWLYSGIVSAQDLFSGDPYFRCAKYAKQTLFSQWFIQNLKLSGCPFLWLSGTWCVPAYCCRNVSITVPLAFYNEWSLQPQKKPRVHMDLLVNGKGDIIDWKVPCIFSFRGPMENLTCPSLLLVLFLPIYRSLSLSLCLSTVPPAFFLQGDVQQQRNLTYKHACKQEGDTEDRKVLGKSPFAGTEHLCVYAGYMSSKHKLVSGICGLHQTWMPKGNSPDVDLLQKPF